VVRRQELFFTPLVSLSGINCSSERQLGF